eukprot:67096-Hanusia_phi.AAC.4
MTGVLSTRIDLYEWRPKDEVRFTRGGLDDGDDAGKGVADSSTSQVMYNLEEDRKACSLASRGCTSENKRARAQALSRCRLGSCRLEHVRGTLKAIKWIKACRGRVSIQVKKGLRISSAAATTTITIITTTSSTSSSSSSTTTTTSTTSTRQAGGRGSRLLAMKTFPAILELQAPAGMTAVLENALRLRGVLEIFGPVLTSLTDPHTEALGTKVCTHRSLLPFHLSVCPGKTSPRALSKTTRSMFDPDFGFLTNALEGELASSELLDCSILSLASRKACK